MTETKTEIQGKCKLCDTWVTNGTRPPCVENDVIPDTCGLIGPVEHRFVEVPAKAETYDDLRKAQAAKQSDAIFIDLPDEEWDKAWETIFGAKYPNGAPGWFEACPEVAELPEETQAVRVKPTGYTDMADGRLYHSTGTLVPWSKLEATKDTTSSLDIQVGGRHYKDAGIQPIEYIFANDLGFCEGNVIKYVTRYGKKSGVQDLKKARHYLDMLIEQLEGKAA